MLGFKKIYIYYFQFKVPFLIMPPEVVPLYYYLIIHEKKKKKKDLGTISNSNLIPVCLKTEVLPCEYMLYKCVIPLEIYCCHTSSLITICIFSLYIHEPLNTHITSHCKIGCRFTFVNISNILHCT